MGLAPLLGHAGISHSSDPGKLTNPVIGSGIDRRLEVSQSEGRFFFSFNSQSFCTKLEWENEEDSAGTGYFGSRSANLLCTWHSIKKANLRNTNTYISWTRILKRDNEGQVDTMEEWEEMEHTKKQKLTSKVKSSTKSLSNYLIQQALPPVQNICISVNACYQHNTSKQNKQKQYLKKPLFHLLY